MDCNRTARRQCLSGLGHRLFVCRLFLSFLLTCPIFVQAGDLSITQVSEADTATRQEETVHLFLDIPFGLSMDECEALLFEHNGTGFDLKSKDDGSGSFSAYILDAQAFDLYGKPEYVFFNFRDRTFYQAELVFHSVALSAEADDDFHCLYTELLNQYGDPTDAYFVQFGEVPNITYYYFPQNNDKQDVEQALSWMTDADDNLGIIINFYNVALCIYKGEPTQTVYSMSLDYSAKYVDTSKGKRIEYIPNL